MARRRRPAIVRSLLREAGARYRAELVRTPLVGVRGGTPTAAELATAVAQLKNIARRGRSARDDEALAVRLLQDPVSSLAKPREPPPIPLAPLKTAPAAQALAKGRPPAPEFAGAPLRSVAKMLETAANGELARLLTELGLGVERGCRLLVELLDYSRPRSAAGVVRRENSLGGLLYEALIPLIARVAAAEDVAIRANALAWARAEPGRFGLTAAELAALERVLAAPELRGTPLAKVADGAGLADVQMLLKNLWQLRLTGVTDVSGRQVTDHFRVLLSVAADGRALDLMPTSLGESKFRSKYADVVPQLITSIERAHDTLRAANLPELAGLPIRIRWGPSVVIVIQSERAPPRSHLDGLAGAVRTAVGKRVSVDVVPGASASDAARARKVVSLALRHAEAVRRGR